MKVKDVQLGAIYLVKVSGKVTQVRLTKACEPRVRPGTIYSRGRTLPGGWVGVNLATGREVRIRSAAKLRRLYAPDPQDAATQRAANALRDPKAREQLAEVGVDAFIEQHAEPGAHHVYREKSAQAETDALGAKLDPQERAKVEESCRKVFKAFLAEVGNSCWEDLPEHATFSDRESSYAYAAAYIDALEARVLKVLE